MLFSRRSSLRGLAVSFVVFSLIVAWPHSAAAMIGFTVGDILCNTYVNAYPYAPFLSTLAWVFGGILLGMGLLKLKDYHESPHNHPVSQGVLRLAAGSLLMALPFTAQFIINTLSLVTSNSIQVAPGGGLICVPGPIVGFPALDLVTMLENFVGNVTMPLVDVVSIVSWLMGILFIIRGLVKGAKYGQDPRASSVPHILAYLVIGGMMLVAGDMAGGVMWSLFGVGSTAMMDYATNVGTVLAWNAVIALGGNVQFATAISAGLTFIQLVGMLSFVRGLYIVKNAIEGSGQATMAQGFTHIIGGTLAINIFNFLEVVDATFGTNLLT